MRVRGLKMKVNNTIRCFFVIVLACLIIFGGYKTFRHFTIIYEELEYAKVFVMDKAKEELGENCKVVTGRYDGQNKGYQIGCINEKGDHAIIYMVKPSINKREWFAFKVSSRIGASAVELFNKVPIIGTR